jgi:hypothetical protein
VTRSKRELNKRRRQPKSIGRGRKIKANLAGAWRPNASVTPMSAAGPQQSVSSEQEDEFHDAADLVGSKSVPAPVVSRMVLSLSAEAAEDLRELAKMTGSRTSAELLRLSLALLKAVYPGILHGQELVLLDPETKSRVQILLPR